MTRTRAVAAGLALTLAVEVGLVAVLIQHTNFGKHPTAAQWLLATSTPVWVLAVFLLSRLRLTRRRAALIVLGVSAVLQVAALTHRPSTSDDDYRYMWDAKVQLAGVDPYSHPPSSPALAHLRTPSIFGAPDHCTYRFPGGCTSINRPKVRTIYPPVAEGAFTTIRVLSFGGQGNHLPLQIAALLGCLAIGWLLLRRRPPWSVAVWAWCPVTVVEFANNAHIDWLAVLLVVLAFVATTRTRWIGVLVGAAIAVKIYPALVLPALMRRNWLVAVVATVVVAITYVPHVLAVGTAVIGYLPGYLHEEQYGSGNRLLLLGAVLPHPFDTVVGALILGAVGLWAWLRAPRDRIEQTAALVVGVAFCVFTPNYGWYAGLLLALVALSGAVEWVPIVLASSFAYLIHSDHDVAIYSIALLLTLVIAAVRHLDSLKGCLRSISPTTAPSPSSPSTPRR